MLSTLFCYASSDMTNNLKSDKSSDEFQEGMASYFTKFIFQTVGYGRDEFIPFEVMRRSVKEVEGEDGGLLKMFCGVD